MVKRNFLTEVNQEYSVSLSNKSLSSSLLKANKSNCFNKEPNIFTYNGIFFDYINNRFFLNKDEYELFQRSKKFKTKETIYFFINDFDINGTNTLLKELKGKTLIVVEEKNIEDWKRGNYCIIDKVPFNKLLLNNEKIIIQSNLLCSSKYKNFFKSSYNGITGSDVYVSDSIYNDYLALSLFHIIEILIIMIQIFYFI